MPAVPLDLPCWVTDNIVVAVSEPRLHPADAAALFSALLLARHVMEELLLSKQMWG